MGAYVNPERIERRGILIAYAGEEMSEGEAKARGLIGATAVEKPLSAMTIPELRAYAKVRGIDLGGASKKDTIVTAIETAPSVETIAPTVDAETE